ncbi:steroid 17-alpha-hydroxylase/17,20 lyase-like [Mytilus trossulus]|uniref:steroid 17-alpha-hydroxylase/17,20 lyase-like n=1 Tax=Mytilus trossulus TaxID=6551 RepID=UPI00300741BE
MIFKSKNRTKRNPPLVKGHVLVGNLFQMDYESMHRTIDKWSKIYGDVLEINILGQKLVSLNTSDAIRNAFLHEPAGTATSARPPTFFGKYALDNFSDTAFASPSKDWTNRRKLVYKLMHTYGEGIANMENQIKNSLEDMKLELTEEAGNSVDPAIIIEEFIMGTVEQLIVGRSFGSGSKLKKILREMDYNFNMLSNLGMDFLFGLFPFLRFFPLKHSKMLKEFEDQKNEMMNLLAKIAEDNPEHKGVYQNMMEEVTKTDKEGRPRLKVVNVKATMLNVVSAGYNTTRGTLLSLVHILATRPELQKLLQTEVDNVIGSDRKPTLRDRENCPLIESVLLETLRYISHVPLSVFHFTADDCEINGYNIQKGTTIIPNLWTAHRYNKDFEHPYMFVPDRFLDKSGNLVPATEPIRKSLMPFGVGKRSCIGEVFARSRMFLFLATLLQTASIEKPDNEIIAEFGLDDLNPGLVMQPKPFKIKFVMRQ